MNLEILKQLAAGGSFSRTSREEINRRRKAQRQIMHNQKTAARRRKNKLRKEESDRFRLQAVLDTARSLGIPANPLGLFLLKNFTPILLKTGRIIWLEMRKLYNIDTLSPRRSCLTPQKPKSVPATLQN